jgi:hypothetical protein
MGNFYQDSYIQFLKNTESFIIPPHPLDSYLLHRTTNLSQNSPSKNFKSLFLLSLKWSVLQPHNNTKYIRVLYNIILVFPNRNLDASAVQNNTFWQQEVLLHPLHLSKMNSIKSISTQSQLQPIRPSNYKLNQAYQFIKISFIH